MYGPLHKLLFTAAGYRYYGILIAYKRGAVEGLMQRFRVFSGKIPQLAYGRVFFEYYLPFPVREYLKGVALPYTQRPPYLFGYNYPAQLVPLCQVGAKKFYKLSEKPLISMALGFPDGATMHLRGFDRLCYFRSKFDRFAPK